MRLGRSRDIRRAVLRSLRSGAGLISQRSVPAFDLSVLMVITMPC